MKKEIGKKEIKVLTLENIACWYKLRWDSNRCGVVFSIHKSAVAWVEDRLRRSRLVTMIEQECGLNDLFNSFNPNLQEGKSCGFGGAIEPIDPRGDFFEFVVPYPQVRKQTGRVCVECSGTGENQLYDGGCFHCRKTGREYVYDWHEGYRVSASVALLFNTLQFPDEETLSGDYQLAEVSFLVEKTRFGIGADVSPTLCTFLNVPRPDIHDSMRESSCKDMNEAHLRIFGRELHKNECRASLREDGHLGFVCPGDACGFYTTDSRDGYSRCLGCKMSDHNVDQPGQLLTLLAGFASFLGSVDRFLSGTYSINPKK